VAGPFYFAWVDAGEVFDPLAHAVEDEQIVALVLNFLHMFSGCPPQVILGVDWRFRLFSPL